MQVLLWAMLYFFDWHAFRTFGDAVYFSLASFTTLGASELSLPTNHRMIGAFESAAGVMMLKTFGRLARRVSSLTFFPWVILRKVSREMSAPCSSKGALSRPFSRPAWTARPAAAVRGLTGSAR